MKIEVDKAGLLALVNSICPNWPLMSKYIEHRYGYYADQGGWFWNKSIEMLSDEKLHEIYRDCIASWE